MNSFHIPNRSVRRQMRAAAKDVAARAAAECFDYTEAGALVRVTDPRAVAVLRRAFAMMLRNGKPVSFQISETEAASFPRWKGTDAGYVHFIAAWLDAEGRCSYHVRSAGVRNLDTGELHPILSAEMAETKARTALAEICARPGFPINQTEGRA